MPDMRNLEKIVMYLAGQKEAWQPIKSIPSTPFSGKTLPFPLSFQLQVEKAVYLKSKFHQRNFSHNVRSDVNHRVNHCKSFSKKNNQSVSTCLLTHPFSKIRMNFEKSCGHWVEHKSRKCHATTPFEIHLRMTMK